MTFVESALFVTPPAIAPGARTFVSFTAARDAGVSSCEWQGPGSFAQACALAAGTDPWWLGGNEWTAPDAGPGFQTLTVRFKNPSGQVLGTASAQVKLILPLVPFVSVPGFDFAASAMAPNGELYLGKESLGAARLLALRGTTVLDAGSGVSAGAPFSFVFPNGRPMFSSSTSLRPYVMEFTGQVPENHGAANDGWVFTPTFPLDFTYAPPDLLLSADGGQFALTRTGVVGGANQDAIELFQRGDAGWQWANSFDGGRVALTKGLVTRLASYHREPLVYFTSPDGGRQLGALHYTGNLTEQDGTPNDGWELLGTPMAFNERIGRIAQTTDSLDRPVVLAMGGDFNANVFVFRFDGSWQPVGTGTILASNPNGADVLGLVDGGLLAAIEDRSSQGQDLVTVYQYTGDVTETEVIPHDGWIQRTLPVVGFFPRLHRDPTTGALLLVVTTPVSGGAGVAVYQLP